MTAIFFHPDIPKHDIVAAHPEIAPDRLVRVFESVRHLPGTVCITPDPADNGSLLSVHREELVKRLLNRAPVTPGGRYAFDAETVMNEHTVRTLRLSAGAACQAVEGVLAGRFENAFCVIYPGHHATPRRAFGFCFINNVAIAARHALNFGAERVAILDIDTHSGNGTIEAFIEQPGDRSGGGTQAPSVLFAETYQPGFPPPFMPGYRPRNVLRRKVTAPFQFRDAWREMLAEVRSYQPQIILVSAGFDAHMADPLGTVQLLDRDYEEIADRILEVSPRVVACLEGGYNLHSTPRCAALFVSRMTAVAGTDANLGGTA